MSELISKILDWRTSYLLTHQFDKTPTIPIIIFEVLIISFALILLIALSKIKSRIFLRFLIVTYGIFIFEFFTSPMWNNYKMGTWAYIYQDVSWILTIGWASLVLCVVILVDKFFSSWNGGKRFCIYLAILTFLVVILESLVIRLGIRSYSPEVKEVVIGYFPFGVPFAALYYVPVFMTLVITFYKYWSFFMDGKPVVPLKQRRWGRSLLISFIGVFLFELMIEPMVVNANLPRWSYIYRDISLIISSGWMIIVWVAINLVDSFFIQLDLFKKFLGYLSAIFLLSLPVEAWLIVHGFRLYGPSATAAFSGIYVPGFNIPIDVAFAIPLYFSLVVSFIKYWEIILDNK